MTDSAKRIEIYQKNLERVDSWIANSDSKISYVLAFSGLLVGYLATQAVEIKQVLLQIYPSKIFVLILFFLVVYLLFLSISLYKGFRVLFPNLKDRGSSHFYFGSIATIDYEQFAKEIKELKDEEIEEELIGQIYINSKIALQKFTNLKESIITLLASFVFWILIVVLVFIS